MAGKHDATVEENETLVQRPCQYAQLIPSTSGMQPLNKACNYQERHQANQPASTNNNSGKPITTKEVKRKSEGNCRYCIIVGHNWIECRKRLRDEANGTYTKTQQRPATADRPTTIQLQAGVPDLWESRALSTRLQKQGTRSFSV